MNTNESIGEKYEGHFQDEWGALTSKYHDFTGKLKIPLTPKERYEMFKNYTAKWYFLNYKKDYLIKDLDRQDIGLLHAYLDRLNEIRKHPQLATPQLVNSKYEQALKIIQDTSTGEFSFYAIDDYKI